MEKIKISVITVCYNCKEDLKKTLESILSQSYTNLETIVVDGYSTDGTRDLLNKYSNILNVIVSERDNGIYDAMNKGIDLCSGEWIIFLNAGDTFTENEILENIFKEEIPEEKTFIYSDYIFVNKNGKKERRRTERAKGIVHHQNAIYKRSLHKKYGYYIVTGRRYIVSDLLFFMSVPEEQYHKTNEPIAFVKGDGVSGGYWVTEQRLCVELIYGIHSFPYIIGYYIKMKVGSILRKLHLRN